MQIRIISLDPLASTTRALLREVEAAFPNVKDVAVSPGVDVRRVSADDLERAGLITRTARHTLTHGRKWHHEVSSKGAVGLAQAVRLALREDETQPLLLLEEDCTFRDVPRLREDVAALLAHAEDFHLAAFGVHLDDAESKGRAVPYLSPGFHELHDHFWMTHCVLFSPAGRRVVADHLSEPLDMQIDSLYGSLARTGHLRVLGQVRHASAVQRVHKSSIQESWVGSCRLCRFPTTRTVVTLRTAVALVVLCHVCHLAWSTEGRRRVWTKAARLASPLSP